MPAALLPIDPSEFRDLKAPYADRQRYARREHAQWMQDHPDFASREMLDEWARIRRHWGIATAYRKTS